MEILAAVLTAVFLWLLVHQGPWSWRPVKMRQAGAFALTLIRPSWTESRRYIPVVLASMLPLMILACGGAWFPFGFFVSSLVALQSVNNLLGSFRGWELHENGLVVRSPLYVYLFPWADLKYCQWKSGQTLRFQFKFYRQEHRLPPEEREAVTEALARYVEVRDEEGRVLAGETRPATAKRDAHPLCWYQFSLRTMLFGVLAISAAASWFGIYYHREAQIRNVLDKFDSFRPEVHRFQRSVNLDFTTSPSKPGDEALESLSQLPGLDVLFLGGAPITDAGLAYIAQCRDLRCLGLSMTGITDVGVVHLEGLGRLKSLNLSGTRITDASVPHLAKLKNLETLFIYQTSLSVEGIRRLQEALPETDIRYQ